MTFEKAMKIFNHEFVLRGLRSPSVTEALEVSLLKLGYEKAVKKEVVKKKANKDE